MGLKKGLTPAYIEQQTIEGLERICRGVSAFVPVELHDKYPRHGKIPYQDREFINFGPTPEDALSMRLAWKAFEALNKSFHLSDDRRNGEFAIELFRRMSLTVCMLGGVASPGDVEYYFEQKLQEQKVHLAQMRKDVESNPLPEWLLDQATEAVKRVENLKLLRAPENIIEDHYRRWGGDGLELSQRAIFNLRLRIVAWEKEAADLEEILSGLRTGNLLPAMLALGTDMEAFADMFEHDKSVYFDEEADDFLPKDGVLSSFVRITSTGAVFDFEGREYYLHRSLLSALQPTVGRA